MKTQAWKELQMKSILQPLVHCFNLPAQRRKMANCKFHHPVTNTWYKKFSGLTSTQDPFSLFLAMITQIQDLYFLRAWPLYSYHLQASSLIHLSDPSQEKRGKVRIKTRIAMDFLTQNLNFSLSYSKTPIPSLDPTSPASYSPIFLFPFAPTSSRGGYTSKLEFLSSHSLKPTPAPPIPVEVCTEVPSVPYTLLNPHVTQWITVFPDLQAILVFARLRYAWISLTTIWLNNPVPQQHSSNFS